MCARCAHIVIVVVLNNLEALASLNALLRDRDVTHIDGTGMIETIESSMSLISGLLVDVSDERNLVWDLEALSKMAD